MAKSKVSGDRGLNFTAKLSIDEAKRNAIELKKIFKDLGISSSKGFDTKPMSAFQQGVFKLKTELNEKNKIWKDLQITESKAKALSAEHKAAVDELKIAEQQLNNELKEGKVTSEQYALAQKKIFDAQKLAISAQKEADRQAGEANKRLKEQLALARQEEAQRERNRKKLERESSEYYKLSQALNNVRGKAKDVLAEMFKLELQGRKNSKEYKELEKASLGLVKQTQILDKGIKKIDDTLGLHQRHVGDYGRAIEGLSPHFASINAALSVFGTSIDQLANKGGMAAFGTAFAGIGKSILKFLISPVGLAITALASLYALFTSNKDTVIEFYDKLLDVGKTTGLAGRNLLDLGNAVIELSKKLETVSAARLLEYATVAGSLGVTGTKDILAFSEALAKLEIASDISGEEGAAEIARLLTLTDGGVQNVKAFGDEIVNLGNAFAATEKEILQNAEAISQNTGLYKLSRQEVLAYATATKSVGLEADVVGSAFARTLSTFEKAIRTGDGVREISKATGLSVDELKSKFKDNASGVFNDFITGLNKVNNSGGSVNEVLEKLGIVAVRDQRVISTLATTGYDVLNKSIETVKNSSGALTAEFDTASGKLKNQTAKFGIAWDNLVLSIENGQGPIGKASASVVGFFTDIVDSISPSTNQFTINEEAVRTLTDRYDELVYKSKPLGGVTKLNRDEQEELKKVIAQIGTLVPGATTAIDKYGNALDINRDKVNKLTKSQREFNELITRDDIKKANKNFDESQSKLPKAQKDFVRINARIGTDKTFLDDVNDFLDGGNAREHAAQLAKDRITRLSKKSYEEAKKIQKLNSELLTSAQKKVIDDVEKEVEVIKKSGDASTGAASVKIANSLRTSEVVKAEIDALEESQKKLDIHSKDYAKNVLAIKKLQKELADANGKETSSGRSIDTALNAQRTLQAEIDALNAKGKRKALSDDQEELAAIDAKYDTLIKKAIVFNKSKKNIERGLKVNTSGLVEGRSDEKDAAIDKQAADKLKVSLDLQKKVYEDFEQYKNDFGLAKAKERFKEQIDTDKTYLQLLQQQREKITNPQKSKGGAEDEAKAEKQLKLLDEQISAETIAEQKKYDSLLKQFIAYSDKRKVLIEERDKIVADFTTKGQTIAAENAKKDYDKQISDLDIANMAKLESYQSLFSGIESLSKINALKLIKDTQDSFEKSVKAGKIVDPAEIAKIRDYLAGLGKTVKKGVGSELVEVANQMDGIISSIGDADSAFSKMLGTVSNVVGQLGNIKKGIKDFKTAGKEGDTLGQLGAGLGILGAGISIFKSVFALFDKSAQREEQASYARDLQNKQTEALNKALERQVALLDEVYGTEKIKKYDEAIKQARDNQAKYTAELAGKYTLTGNKELDDILTKINNGEEGVFNGFNAAFIKQNQSKLDTLKIPTDIATLQKLLDEGKLDANTGNIVQNLIKAKETADQLANSLRAENVGSSLAQIADDFISTLTDGTQDFGKTFEQTIQKSILNGFKGELIRKQLQAFYEQFAKLSDGGLSSAEIEVLRASYLAASEKAKSDLEALSKATGIDLTGDAKDGPSPNSLKGAYSTASQESITLLAGQTAGMRLAQLQTNAILTPISKSIGEMYQTTLANFNELQAINANTLRTANNTDRLANIETALVSMDKKIGSANSALVANGRI